MEWIFLEAEWGRVLGYVFLICFLAPGCVYGLSRVKKNKTCCFPSVKTQCGKKTKWTYHFLLRSVFHLKRFIWLMRLHLGDSESGFSPTF